MPVAAGPAMSGRRQDETQLALNITRGWVAFGVRRCVPGVGLFTDASSERIPQDSHIPSTEIKNSCRSFDYRTPPRVLGESVSRILPGLRLRATCPVDPTVPDPDLLFPVFQAPDQYCKTYDNE